MSQRFFAIRDSNDPEKNISNQITDYVWNIWQKDNRIEAKLQYPIVTKTDVPFLIAADIKTNKHKTDSLFIIEEKYNVICGIKEQDIPHFELNIPKIMETLDKHESLFLISHDVSNKISHTDLLNSLQLAIINNAGKFCDYKTKKPLSKKSQNEIPVLIVMGMFKMGELPIYVSLLNSDCIENKCYDEFEGDEIKYISVLKESRSLKDEIFSPAYRKGFVTQIGKHDMYVHGDEFIFEVFGEYLAEIPNIAKAIYEDSMVYPYKNQIINLENQIKAYSNWPTRVDEVGKVYVDMTNVPTNSTGFLRVEIEAGEFFKYWIFKNHRTIYEFALHKIDGPVEQGTIISPGFY